MRSASPKFIEFFTRASLIRGHVPCKAQRNRPVVAFKTQLWQVALMPFPYLIIAGLCLLYPKLTCDGRSESDARGDMVEQAPVAAVQ